MAKKVFPQIKGVLILGLLLGLSLFAIAGAIILSLMGLIDLGSITGSAPVKTSKEDHITIAQSYLSGIALTNAKAQDNYEVFYYFTPTINLESLPSASQIKVTKLEVVNVKLSNMPNGANYTVLAPKHIDPAVDTRDIYFEMDFEDFDYNFQGLANSAAKINYPVIEGAFSNFRDDYSQNGDFIEFRVLVYNAGNFNYETILNRDNLYESSRVLQYAGIAPQELNGELSFTIMVEFDNGEKSFKDINFILDGQTLLDTGFMNVDANIDGATF